MADISLPTGTGTGVVGVVMFLIMAYTTFRSKTIKEYEGLIERLTTDNKDLRELQTAQEDFKTQHYEDLQKIRIMYKEDMKDIQQQHEVEIEKLKSQYETELYLMKEQIRQVPKRKTDKRG